MTLHYKVALRRDEKGYSVSCPALPGCWSQGETEEEALANIRLAIAEYLEVVDTNLLDAEVREVEIAA